MTSVILMKRFTQTGETVTADHVLTDWHIFINLPRVTCRQDSATTRSLSVSHVPMLQREQTPVSTAAFITAPGYVGTTHGAMLVKAQPSSALHGCCALTGAKAKAPKAARGLYHGERQPRLGCKVLGHIAKYPIWDAHVLG